MAFDTSEADRRIRAIAAGVFPALDSSYWYSDKYSENEILVVGRLKSFGYPWFGIYSFLVNTEHNLSYRGDILLNNHARKQGYGRKLVEAREAIALELGAHMVIININDNFSFWKHLDYDPIPSSLGLFLEKNLRRVHSHNPMYKLLSEA